MSELSAPEPARTPPFPHTLRFLGEIGVPVSTAAACLARARATGRSIDAILAGSGLVSEDAFERALERQVGPAGSLATRGPARIAASLRADIEGRIAYEAANALPDAEPRFSVRDGLSPRERAGARVLAAIVLVIGATSPGATVAALMALCGVLFLFGSALRLSACWRSGEREPFCPPLPDAALPRYTILAPLRREGRVLPQLVQALCALDYPAAKLDIKLLVEADDTETILAAGRVTLPSHVAVVICPAGKPRTKPRALNIGLRSATGGLLVIYDAEDLPDLNQLRLAAARFAAGPPDLACLQAQLVVHNHRACRLARLFALEYAALFQVVIPGFARLGVPIPLGGTSNHFRVDVLRRVRGWDAWNVAEDADLGLRLFRLGWTVGSLRSATREEAVITRRAWLAQRSRWIKGWMQASLVHARGTFGREPAGLVERTTILSHTVGLVLAALGMPFFMAALIWRLCDGSLLGPTGVAQSLVSAFAFLVMLAGAPALFWPLALGARRAGLNLRAADIGLFCLYVPLMCVAAWRALWELAHDPQGWNKTEHGLSPAPRSLGRRVLDPRPLKGSVGRPWPIRRPGVAG